jgi:hypothetical protein
MFVAPAKILAQAFEGAELRRQTHDAGDRSRKSGIVGRRQGAMAVEGDDGFEPANQKIAIGGRV